MSRIYIANCTTQHHEFFYRLPERNEPVRQPIPLGHCVVLAGGRQFNTLEVEGIIKQHERYGLIPVSMVQRSMRGRGFSGLCYQLDKPIDVERVRMLYEHNRTVLSQRGEQIRRDAAIATSNNLEREQFEQQLPGTLRHLDFQVEEVYRDPKDDSPEINQGVHVNRAVPPDGIYNGRAADGPMMAAVAPTKSARKSRRVPSVQ